MGHWSGDSGGNRMQTSWISNPKIRMVLPDCSTAKSENGKKYRYSVTLYLHAYTYRESQYCN